MLTPGALPACTMAGGEAPATPGSRAEQQSRAEESAHPRACVEPHQDDVLCAVTVMGSSPKSQRRGKELKRKLPVSHRSAAPHTVQ